jgi:hypothetical protein
MLKSRNILLAAAASVALVGAAGAATAQTLRSQTLQSQTLRSEPGQTITVPPGAVVVIMPGAAAPAMLPGVVGSSGFADVGMPFPVFPDPDLMLRQVGAMMDQAFAAPAFASPDRTIEAALRGLKAAPNGVSSVTVTTISNGHGSCTRRVVYPGDGATPKIDVSDTGNACAALGLPASDQVVAPHRMPARTIEARAARPDAPIQLAQLGD